MTAPLWQDRRVVVCVGTGGVGKTTVAAALAMAAASQGRKVAVMTIDPSKRLSQALGLDANDTGMQEVSLAYLAKAKVPLAPGGTLHALMLDVQHTFDSLIRSRAHSPQAAQAILGNRIYKHFSASLAGSHEYAAVEKLWDLYQDPSYDLIVLDTPPSHHALDFLDAPGRIVRFLQGQNGDDSQAQAKPSFARQMGQKLFDLGGSLVTRTVGRVSGAETLQEVTGFLQSLKDMYASFNACAQGVESLLQSDEVAFTLVGGPSQAQVSALEHFAQELGRFNIKPAAWVLNRMHPACLQQDDRAYAMTAVDALAGGSKLTLDDCAGLKDAIDSEMAMALRDGQQLLRLRENHPKGIIMTVNDQPQGAESLERLAALSHTLLRSSH